ncbi:hypothetical protein PN36_19385 [Candidatus Thiomargarita nelsonii]|uniref:Double-GTPase 2 domain-containing protein n=1 Tax=Candidatus Thiomargarita nelsonii TaxID=1003181 RepID=A0A0A6S6B2_9GAMM|nr:hypothetical protein PN36_19385 [Candidatus Thiomargarita nelsonii]
MNDKYLCLNCWRISKVDDLFSVAQKPYWREPPGRQRLGDLYHDNEWRQILFGLAPRAPYQLAIQDSRNVECQCGKPMPPCAKLPNKLLAIRLIGPKNSGKTLFLITMLDSFNKLEEMALRRICNTNQHFDKFSSVLLRDRRRPAPTMTGESYVWEIMDAQRTHPVLAFHDIGGQIWEQMRHPKNLTNYLALPGHLILVLDGARIAHDLNLASQDAWDANPEERNNIDDLSILEHITENWEKADYNKTKLALVITKADILWNEYPLLQEVCASLSKTDEKQEDLKKLMRQSGRNALIIFAEQRFRDTYEIFATSSLGFCPEENDVNTDDPDKLERQPNPEGTLLPLQWLLNI